MQHIDRNTPFREAVVDYHTLLNKGYPEERIRQLVSNRYQLDRHQSSALFRGVFPESLNRSRIDRRVTSAAGRCRSLSIDFPNVLLVLMNYLFGRNVFIATDLLVRDDGENFKGFNNQGIITRALYNLYSVLAEVGIKELTFYIDSEPSLDFLKRERLESFHTAELRPALDALERYGVSPKMVYTSSLRKSVIESPESCIATSNSRILDAAEPRPFFDLAAYILYTRFDADLANLHNLIYKPPLGAFGFEGFGTKDE